MHPLGSEHALSESSRDGLARWQNDRFGMSLHFGLYSVPARGEWVSSVERLGREQYRRYLDHFDPEPGWAVDWARMARAAGARYAVLTAKHHDGFCLFDSALTDFKATRAAARRDLVREWVDAVRTEGLSVGLYYSLVDWDHPDYPAAGDRQHPLRHHPEAPSRDQFCDWSRYVSYLHGQLIELCSDYGRIDSLVVDFSYWDYCGEKWGATEIQRRLRALQPGMLFNDRWGNEPRKRVPRPTYAGDFEQTEQNIPAVCLCDDAGEPMPWEAWFTLNNAWCFSANDHDWKSARSVIHALVNCVSKDGNLLLNVSPDARGRVPGAARSILSGVGDWIQANERSIRGAGAAPYPKPEWGRFTSSGGRLFAHIMEPVIGHIPLSGLRGTVSDGHLLATGSEVLLTDYWNPGIQTFDGPRDIFFNFATPVSWTFPLPDERDTVVEFSINSPEAATRECHLLDRKKAASFGSRLPFS